MPSTVFANGKAVATTKTPHMARSEPHDERLVNKTKKTALPNYIESEFLTRQLPELTEFNSGKIWVFPSECGLPPPSKPADGWPGANNGMQVNSYAKAAPGEGSINVFVEGDKVIRHTDKTKQNAGNSDGIIDDLANLQAYLDKFKPPETAAPPATAKGGGDAKKPEGATTDDDGREEEPPKVEDKGKPPVNPDCEVIGVFMTATVNRERLQHPKEADVADAKIEVLADQVVDFIAFGHKICGDHPVWIPPEGERAGAKSVMQFKYTTASNNRWSQLFKPTPVGWMAIFDAKPNEYTIICRDHNRDYKRLIRAFPKDVVKVEVKFEKKLPEAKPAFIKWLTEKIPGFKFKLEPPQYAIIGSAGWTRQDNWRCRCDGKVGGQGTLFKFTAEAQVEFYAFAGPAGAIIKAINWVFQTLTGAPLGTIYGFARVKASVGFDLTGIRRKWYGTDAKWSAAEGKGFGQVYFEFGIAGALGGDVVKVEAFGSIGAAVEGVVLIADWDLKLGLRVKFEGFKVVFSITWDLMSLFKHWTGWIPWADKLLNKFEAWLASKGVAKLKGETKTEIVIFGPSNYYPLGEVSIRKLFGLEPLGGGGSLET